MYKCLSPDERLCFAVGESQVDPACICLCICLDQTSPILGAADAKVKKSSCLDGAKDQGERIMYNVARKRQTI